MLLSLWVISIGCGRLVNTNTSELNLIYINHMEDMYEYNGRISKLNHKKAQNIHLLGLNKLHVSMESSVEIMDNEGNLLFYYEPGKTIASSAINNKKNEVYYVNENGALFLYNYETNHLTNVDIQLYPIPKQMFFDELNHSIYYHDNENIYELNLKSLRLSKLIKDNIPIQSIVYHKNKKVIYFSTSVSGKIYQIDIGNRRPKLIHQPMSAKGTALSLDTDKNILYFSRSNGRDIQIQSMDLINDSIHHNLTLFNVNNIRYFVVKDA